MFADKKIICMTNVSHPLVDGVGLSGSFYGEWRHAGPHLPSRCQHRQMQRPSGAGKAGSDVDRVPLLGSDGRRLLLLGRRLLSSRAFGISASQTRIPRSSRRSLVGDSWTATIGEIGRGRVLVAINTQARPVSSSEDHRRCVAGDPDARTLYSSNSATLVMYKHARRLKSWMRHQLPPFNARCGYHI